MISKAADSLLVLLTNIEKALAGIYGSFAVSYGFTDEVRRFWATMMEAELEHAALFRNIRAKAKNDDTIQVEFNFTKEQLITSYKQIKRLEKYATGSEISEKKAYSLGVLMEEGLYEFSYTKRVSSNSREVMESIKKIEDDTKNHYVLLHNYSLGVKGALGPS
jgi:rubrerythrin